MSQSPSAELEKFRQYLRSESSEDARRPLLYPLFQKLFKDKFKIESDAHGADVYVEGKLLVESKTAHHQWLDAFYQALHCHRRYGLTYNTIMLVAHNFAGIWKLDKIPETAVIFHRTSDPHKAPNEIGKENAKKTTAALRREIKDAAFYWLEPRDLEGDIFAGAKNLTTESFEILKILNNLDSDRLQINSHNFINSIKRFEPFFDTKIAAVHCFYDIVAYWDITSTVADRPNGKVCLIGFNGKRSSDDVEIKPRLIHDFKKLIETSYIFTNEGSGLTVDYYFSRFDEVLAEIDPEYVKQHGIFFTNDNLSKFALWFVKEHFSKELAQNYIVFDPAGGSGNLVSSWKGKLKHKIVSELQPDLLKIIERRMKVDPFSVETGFTIIPKTSDNKGLNFLDCSAKEYLSRLEKELQLKNIKMDKPLAFLLNPPYKNTDENVKAREDTDSHYELHPSIIELTGEDAAKERYLAFLGQILNIAKEQVNEFTKVHPVVMIFTPTSWLIPRNTYIPFRKEWNKYFKYHSGFIVTSNEWFKLDGKWPLSFTIWTYNHNEQGNDNKVKVLDLNELEKKDLNISWNAGEAELNKLLKEIIRGKKTILLDNSRGSIKERTGQKMYDFKRDATKEEIKSGKIFGGLPLKDERRDNKKTYGITDSSFIGFMDDCTPVRVKQDNLNRLTNEPDRVWFRLDSPLKDINKAKCFNGPTDNRSYCAYDLPSSKSILSWFAITKALNGVYPVWANQYDIWAPNIKIGMEKYWYSLCFAFVLAENRCVVTKFEKDNPIHGAPEVWVDNPLSPANKESFWSMVLDKEIAPLPPKGGLLGKSEKSSTFVKKRTEDEIRNILSGESEVSRGANIQAALVFLRTSQGAGEKAQKSGSFKEQEEKRLIPYITEHNLWVDTHYTTYLSEGAEQIVYFLGDYVIKLNGAAYYGSWSEYFTSLLLHNYFFADTAYELKGFARRNGALFAVVKQPFVAGNPLPDMSAVGEFMHDNGFVSTRKTDYRNDELGIILEDLHDENVLINDEGTLFFIDTVFYLTASSPVLNQETILIEKEEKSMAWELVNKIKELYKFWNFNYCKGQIMENIGLQDEPYFKYFDYPDFLTPHSGLIQIRKYAEKQGDAELLQLFEQVSKLTKAVKNEIYRLLVEEFGYFE